jgi:hypothetical protein
MESLNIGELVISFVELDVGVNNFKRAPKIDFSTAHPGRQTSKFLGCLTTVILKEVRNYFVINLFCMTVGFVDDK